MVLVGVEYCDGVGSGSSYMISLWLFGGGGVGSGL